MTAQEAKQYILQNYFDGDENVNAVVWGDEEIQAMMMAIQALDFMMDKCQLEP